MNTMIERKSQNSCSIYRSNNTCCIYRSNNACSIYRCCNALCVIFIEYEGYLEEQKTEMSSKKLINNTDTLAIKKMEREIDQADQEVVTLSFI